MPDFDAEARELRRQMREGRTPLIEAVCAAWQKFFIANKGLSRKTDELREQVGLLQNEFLAKGKQLRSTSHKTTSLREQRDSSETAIPLFEGLSAQAKAVAELIDKELPKLTKLENPVANAYEAYRQSFIAYREYMANWRGRLSDEDLTDRSLDVALDQVEKSLR
jgi:chromosome segregation ATPase